MTTASHQLTGSCPCSSITWTTTTRPSGITICHCNECRSFSPFKSPVAFSNVPNTSVHFSTATDSTPTSYKPNIRIVETELAVRGVCKNCGVLIYMNYHCEPEDTSLNMGLCHDEEMVKAVREAKEHIFYEGEVGDGETGWKGFPDRFGPVLEKWKAEGRKRREDI